MTTEAAFFRSYITAFNDAKDFSEVESEFDALFHEDFTLLQDGSTLNRDEVKKFYASLLEKGTKITIIQCRKIGFGVDILDVQFRIKNEDEEQDVRIFYLVQQNKLTKAEEIQDGFFSATGAYNRLAIKSVNWPWSK